MPLIGGRFDPPRTMRRRSRGARCAFAISFACWIGVLVLPSAHLLRGCGPWSIVKGQASGAAILVLSQSVSASKLAKP
jgi:hypothetical protein